MVVGGILAAVLAVFVFLSSKRIVGSTRDRISLASFVSGTSLISTGAFLVSVAAGYIVVGLSLLAISLLLGYQSGE